LSEPRTEDLADLYEEAPCGYLSMCPDGRIVKANRTLADWLGREPASLLDKPVHDILSFGGRIAYETHIAPLLRMQGHVDEVALDVLHADGSKLPVLCNAAEKRGQDGAHLFTRLTLLKAVERRTYERNLQASLLKAEKAYTAEHDMAVLREQFIAVLGHDLRNPLAALRAGTDMLERRESFSERGERVLREMNASIARASALVENVLDFARNRLGQGMTVTRDADAPLEPVLEHIVAELRMIEPERAIDAEFSIDDPVDCDRNKIGQLASNLLANAVTHGARDVAIKFRAETLPDRFVLSVANAGPPLDAKTRESLFQPFFRGGARPSRNGLGLGLFIVKEIAEAHGGTIEVESSAEETRFVFSMPLARPE
jgi:phosphoserine phosphatase RsbU/P